MMIQTLFILWLDLEKDTKDKVTNSLTTVFGYIWYVSTIWLEDDPVGFFFFFQNPKIRLRLARLRFEHLKLYNPKILYKNTS